MLVNSIMDQSTETQHALKKTSDSNKTLKNNNIKGTV